MLDEAIAKFKNPDTISAEHSIRSRPGVFDDRRLKAEKNLAYEFHLMTIDLFKNYDDQKPVMEVRAVEAASFGKYGQQKDLTDPVYLTRLEEARLAGHATDSVHVLAVTGAELLERFHRSGYEFQTPGAQAWLAYRQKNDPSIKLS